MIAFLGACVTLVVMIWIGGFILNLIFMALGLIFVWISTVWEKLTGG